LVSPSGLIAGNDGIDCSGERFQGKGELVGKRGRGIGKRKEKSVGTEEKGAPLAAIERRISTRRS